MKIKELPTWPPRSELKSVLPPKNMSDAVMRNPRRTARGVEWTVETQGRVETLQLQLLNPSLLDRLWPVFLEMQGQSLRVIGERNIPERGATTAAPSVAAPVSPARLTLPGPARRSSLSAPPRRLSRYGDFDNQGHGDGNVG